MRTLALDYGSVRVGLAISDELGMIAQPIDFLDATPEESLMKGILKVVAEREVGLILVGMPRNMDGSYGPAAEGVKVFVAKLQALTQIRIRTWDERLTTAQANRVLLEGNVRRDKRKERVDAVAAAVLLQSFLDLNGS